MTEEQAKQLLEKYQDGEPSAAEVQKVDHWYKNLDNDNSIPALQKSAIKSRMFYNIKSAINRKPVKFTPWYRNSLNFAAAFVLSAFTGILFIIYSVQTKPHTESEYTICTTSVKPRKLYLNDGSEITMEPFSSVRYPKHFERNYRKISLLKGEAFFNVAHDEKKRFQVDLPANLTVRVLGTSFRIRAYGGSDTIDVAVATGKVAISRMHNPIGTLIRNQSLKFNKRTLKALIEISHERLPVKIELSGTSLEQLARKLSYIYTINIQVSDQKILNLKTTGSFSSQQSPQEILEIICSLHHLRYSSDKSHKSFKIFK